MLAGPAQRTGFYVFPAFDVVPRYIYIYIYTMKQAGRVLRSPSTIPRDEFISLASSGTYLGHSLGDPSPFLTLPKSLTFVHTHIELMTHALISLPKIRTN